MLHRKRLSIFIIALLATGWACALSDYLPNFDPNVLYEDDFSNSNSGWIDERDDFSFTGYQDDGYRIEVTDTFYDVWVTAGETLEDVSIQVEATKIGGSDNNDFGLICRAVDLDNYYAALISSDGYYGLFMTSGGSELLLIDEESMLPSDIIKQGNATNIIRMDCVGNSISLYVNGELVAQAQNSEFASGDVGLLVGTFDTAPTDILFDNLIVTKPE